MLDGPVFCSQPGWVLVESFALKEAPQNVFDDLLIHVKVGNPTPDVFLRRIAQQVELGLVRTHDCAVRGHEMKADGSVLKEVLQILEAPAILDLEFLARSDVLETTDRANGLTTPVLDGLYVGQGPEASTVRLLDDDFDIMGRNAGPKSATGQSGCGKRVPSERKRR
jgi:hypothetical protein